MFLLINKIIKCLKIDRDLKEIIRFLGKIVLYRLKLIQHRSPMIGESCQRTGFQVGNISKILVR